MVYLGVDFDEHQYEQGDGPEFSRDAWLSVKETLGLKFPNLPYLIDGELKLTETNAIMKYIAHKYGPQLLGGDAATVAQVEMVAGIVGDLKGAVTMPCYTTNDRQSIKAIALQKVRPIVDFLGEKKFLIGNDVTYIDFTMFELCDLMDFITEGELLGQYPTLKAYSDRVKGLPRVAEYYDDDERCMKRPFNNKVAKINN